MGLLDRFRKPTLDRFAADLMERLRAAGVRDELRYEPEECRIVRLRKGEYKGEMGLANMFQKYESTPYAQRAAVLTSCVRTMLASARELPEEFDEAKPDLRAKFWSRAGVEHLRLRGLVERDDDGGPDLTGEPMGAHLLLSLAFDWPDSSSSVPPSMLEKWGVSVYEALEAARENLDATLEGYAKLGDGLYIVKTGDSYDAARLALVDRIRGMEVTGQHVAMVPNRDVLLVTGSEDDTSLAMMIALAEQGLTEPYPLSGVPLILGEDGWADWTPPRDHAFSRAFRDMELNWIGPMYTEQKKLLEALHQKKGVDVFVASFSAAKKNDDTLFSYCVWGEGVDTLLPVTQKVFILREGQKDPAAVGDWERVREVAGHLMEETEHYPPRYRVREFPNQAVLDAIGVEPI